MHNVHNLNVTLFLSCSRLNMGTPHYDTQPTVHNFLCAILAQIKFMFPSRTLGTHRKSCADSVRDQHDLKIV